MSGPLPFDDSLILAAEECPPDRFAEIHSFTSHDDLVIQKLIAHGPVLLKGGRGSGKSALLIEAQRRSLALEEVFSVYVSLRYLPLLQSEGQDYINHFCERLSDIIREALNARKSVHLLGEVRDQASLQDEVNLLASKMRKRIVLLFDDAAHIGREAPLEIFFDLFRALSTSVVSCKASIYPGVTKFGVRFDVFNDATVIDVNRLDTLTQEKDFFLDVLRARYPKLANPKSFSDRLLPGEFARFLGRAVVGNMRGFVLACSKIGMHKSIGIPQVNSCILDLAQDYYWPLMEEVAPKLGVYEPLIEPAREVMERIVEVACKTSKATPDKLVPAQDRILIDRRIVGQLGKVFEILEYLGFVARREASRAMKSGGRGTGFVINLCNLIDQMPRQRLTREILQVWSDGSGEMAEIHLTSGVLSSIVLPPPPKHYSLSILQSPIDVLKKSRAYPYGLTEDKVERLHGANISTVGDLANASDATLLVLQRVGDRTVERIRNVVYQAIWM